MPRVQEWQLRRRVSRAPAGSHGPGEDAPIITESGLLIPHTRDLLTSLSVQLETLAPVKDESTVWVYCLVWEVNIVGLFFFNMGSDSTLPLP